MERSEFFKALGLTALAAAMWRGEKSQVHIEKVKVRLAPPFYGDEANTFEVPVPVADNLEGLRQLGVTDEEITHYVNQSFQLRYQAMYRRWLKEGSTVEDAVEAIKNYRPGRLPLRGTELL